MNLPKSSHIQRNSVRMAPRRRRNLGAPLYAYNTETAEETGNWEEWQMAPTGPVCSRTCGGGVMIETRVCDKCFYKKGK